MEHIKSRRCVSLHLSFPLNSFSPESLLSPSRLPFLYLALSFCRDCVLA